MDYSFAQCFACKRSNLLGTKINLVHPTGAHHNEIVVTARKRREMWRSDFSNVLCIVTQRQFYCPAIGFLLPFTPLPGSIGLALKVKNNSPELLHKWLKSSTFKLRLNVIDMLCVFVFIYIIFVYISMYRVKSGKASRHLPSRKWKFYTYGLNRANTISHHLPWFSLFYPKTMPTKMILLAKINYETHKITWSQGSKSCNWFHSNHYFVWSFWLSFNTGAYL